MTVTIIIGNGMGMALDPEYFSLRTGIRDVIEQFPKEEKPIIRLGLNEVPTEENDLENNHLVLSACETLMTHQNNQLCWLSGDGKKFPDVYQNFIYKVAKYFFDYEGYLNKEFVDSLCLFIERVDCCHIATLNYDKLLYQALIDRKVLNGYDDKLVDGFYTETIGFDQDNLIRKYGKQFGWYLHLHGSPLFYTSDDNVINKNNYHSLPKDAKNNNRIHKHIVLTSSRYKPSVISKSSLLSDYFDFFVQALGESDTLFLFGYLGEDKHVNFQVQNWCATHKDGKVYVIEWIYSRYEEDRQEFWDSICGNTVELIQKYNILEYRFAVSQVLNYY